MSSCWTRRAIRDFAVISVSFACNTVRPAGQPRETAISKIILYTLAGLALLMLLRKLQMRLQLSHAKHRSLTGHSRMARRFASLVPFYEYGESQFFDTDRAPGNIAATRRAGFMRLAAIFEERFKKTAALTGEISASVSDLQFTSRYRVPFQFSGLVRQYFRTGSFAESSSGVTVTDLDGNGSYDLTGSYGVNVFGYDFYKECIERGAERVRGLGPVLGAYHPVTAYNIRRLLQISGLDEVSFHMSGTEAVMQAVRLARYHTRRTHLVRFCGAYHGWWGDVQPGVGNPLAARETYTLKDMDEASLRVLRSRRDIACVLVNPLQALHPNVSAPGDSTLIDSGRTAAFDRGAYADWLTRLREVCTRAGHRADFRRGLCRIPAGPRRRAGILRRARRHGHLRQDGRGRAPRGSALRPAAVHAPFPRGPAGRHLLRPRNIQFASLRHGFHVRIFAAAGCRSGAQSLPRSRRNLERQGSRAE